MNQDEKKIKVAEAALEYIESGQVIGIGSGTTVHALIDKIDKVKNKIDAVVSSSELTTQMVEAKNIRVIQLKESGTIPLYIDGADESNQKKEFHAQGCPLLFFSHHVFFFWIVYFSIVFFSCF